MSKSIQRIICLIFAVLLFLSIILMFSGCDQQTSDDYKSTLLSGYNRQIFDFTYNFNRAIIRLPDGDIVEGRVDSWMDFEDGDQLQIKIDGVTYLVHSSNCVLISGEEK